MQRRPLFRSSSLVIAGPIYPGLPESAGVDSYNIDTPTSFCSGSFQAMRCTELQVKIKYARTTIEYYQEKRQDLYYMIQRQTLDAYNRCDAYRSKISKAKSVIYQLFASNAAINADITRLSSCKVDAPLENSSKKSAQRNSELHRQTGELGSRAALIKSQSFYGCSERYEHFYLFETAMTHSRTATEGQEQYLEQYLAAEQVTARILLSQLAVQRHYRTARATSLTCLENRILQLQQLCDRIYKVFDNTVVNVAKAQDQIASLLTKLFPYV